MKAWPGADRAGFAPAGLRGFAPATRAAVAAMIEEEKATARRRALGVTAEALTPETAAGLGRSAALNACVAEAAAAVFRVREARLAGEALELLTAGAAWEDLCIVTSPLIPDGQVMTGAGERAHAAELVAGVTRWAGLP